MDKETAFIKPFIWHRSIECGDKNGHYSISEDMLPEKYAAIAWDELYRLIHEKDD